MLLSLTRGLNHEPHLVMIAARARALTLSRRGLSGAGPGASHGCTHLGASLRVRQHLLSGCTASSYPNDRRLWDGGLLLGGVYEVCRCEVRPSCQRSMKTWPFELQGAKLSSRGIVDKPGCKGAASICRIGCEACSCILSRTGAQGYRRNDKGSLPLPAIASDAIVNRTPICVSSVGFLR